MTITTNVKAAAPGWQVAEVVCRAGPGDRATEEQHDRICVAVVLDGTFGYRSSRGEATLAPGAILLGNAGDCFSCGHEHSIGDRCLSFQYDPGFFEDIVAAMPGARTPTFAAPSLAPDRRRTRFAVAAETTLDDPAALEELALEIAAHAAGTPDTPCGYARRGSRTGRIEEVAHWVAEQSDQTLPLAYLAARAGMSPYHFLREFKREIGVTPHQFVLERRLRQAARRLRNSRETVLEIALASGFADLSEFTRRFHRLIGCTPSAFRTARSVTALRER